MTTSGDYSAIINNYEEMEDGDSLGPISLSEDEEEEEEELDDDLLLDDDDELGLDEDELELEEDEEEESDY